MAALPDLGPTTSSARVAAYRACTPAERSDALRQLAALLSATQAELLDLVTAADAEGDWKADGATDMAAAVVATCHVGKGTARDWVRVGRALDVLPHLREAFAAGRLSWDQVGPATTYVTADTDADEAEHLPGCTATQIEGIARRHRVIRTRDAARSAQQRRFTWRPDHDHHGFRYSGFLPADEGAILNAALDRAAQAIGPDADTGTWAPHASRCADGLVALGHQHLREDLGTDPSLAVVHVDAEVVDALRAGNGSVDGIQIAQATVLRLLCDTTVEYSVDGPDGTCIGIGRAGRTVPRWLRRRILHRDGTCRFPGCERPIRHVHHLVHWSAGGVTDSWNLLGVCWDHHHLVHEGGWSVAGNADLRLTFTSPYGRELASSPEPLRSEVRGRISDAVGLRLSDPSPPGDVGETEPAAADEPARLPSTPLQPDPPCRLSGTPQRRRGP